MATLVEKATFVAELVGKAREAEVAAQVMDARKQTLDDLLGRGFSDQDRDDLRSAMTFTVQRKDGKTIQAMDERGQRKSIETEDAINYQAIDAQVAQKAQAALEKIAAIKQKLLAQTTTVKGLDANGQEKDEVVPLFKEEDLAAELYTPLVRAGLMPEGLVMDDHSETAQLLKNAFKSYKQMLSDARRQQAQDEAETEANFHNAGTAKERASAISGKMTGVVQAKVSRVGASIGLTPEEMARASNMVISGAMLTVSTATLGLASASLATTVQTDGQPRTPTEQSALKAGVTLTKDSAKVVYGGLKSAKDIYSAADAYSKADENIDKVVKQASINAALKSAAEDALQQVDEALSAKLGTRIAIEAMSGKFFEAVDIDAVVEAAADKKAQTKAIIDPIAHAFAAYLAGASPRSETKAAFATAAQQVKGMFASVALAPGSEPPVRLFLPLIGAAQAFQFDDAFLDALRQCAEEFTEQARQANEYLVDHLATIDEETEEFERQLMLIDEAGEDMARERSLAKMTEQLKADAAKLELVNKLGTLIGSFGTSAVTLSVNSANVAVGALATGVQTVATTVGQELVPALKAAQLVIQMSVSVIKIAQRAQLLKKFQDDILKAKKAGSVLVSAVENFRNNKVSQEVFASIELAMQAIQLAGAICQTVPEPITMAAGKVVSAVGSVGAGANSLAKQVYDDRTLRKGWKVTLEAMNHPKNRRAGLDAIYKNTTLAIHSIAWAATKKSPDPVALEILNSVGVNAQTLADSASDGNAVIDYLETKLAEDPQFKDADKVKSDWVPSPLPFSYVGWFTVKNRAQTRATPPLGKGDTADIDKAFKALDRAADDDELKCAQTLLEHLRAYQPLDVNGAKHEEMRGVVRQYVEEVESRVAELTPDTADPFSPVP